MLWVSNVVMAQTEVRLTQEEVFRIHNSKEYVYGSGWHEVKENAIANALEELKIKLQIQSSAINNYNITQLDSDDGYYFMVYIKKSTSQHSVPPSSPTPTSQLPSQTISDLYKSYKYDEFITKFRIYNRQNKVWGSVNKEDMTNISNCYVAIFDNTEMVVFLDKGGISRKDFLSGNIISDFETRYDNNKFKIIWIELIEN